jgi:tRNA nucleotidyltransferase (CCA-adding enzyme)
MKEIFKQKFVKDLRWSGGEVYIVGGGVRDDIMGRKPKDIDLIVTRLPLEKIIKVLEKYGNVNDNGAPYGIVKFTPQGQKEVIDIVIPRNSKSQKYLDPEIPIEHDLSGRDITINSMAYDIYGNLYDPSQGKKDIKNKLIKADRIDDFERDALKILRIIRFAARLEFDFDEDTWIDLCINAHKVKNIEWSRVVKELHKMYDDGNYYIATYLMVLSGVYAALFGKRFSGDIEAFRKVSTFEKYFAMLEA